MTIYVNIDKPSGTSYTNINTVGKQQYDQADIIYDDPNVFYDGMNVDLYTKISKPSSTSYINLAKPS